MINTNSEHAEPNTDNLMRLFDSLPWMCDSQARAIDLLEKPKQLAPKAKSNRSTFLKRCAVTADEMKKSKQGMTDMTTTKILAENQLHASAANDTVPTNLAALKLDYFCSKAKEMTQKSYEDAANDAIDALLNTGISRELIVCPKNGKMAIAEQVKNSNVVTLCPVN